MAESDELVGRIVSCQRDWKLVAPIGAGGFGQVFVAESAGERMALKLISKEPGSDRELLFEDLSGTPNVVPVVEHGEFEGYWALVMPLAECSLRDRMLGEDRLELEEIVDVLLGISAGLAGLDGRVIHRDLKPENVLLLDDCWSLADFGIAKYAEQATGTNTHKFKATWVYAAPERWKFQSTTAATDVYSFGVMAYELVAGDLPFDGKTREELADAHLHETPARLTQIPDVLGSLIEECLYKAPEARPSAANIESRLQKVLKPARLAGLASLQAANRDEVARIGEQARAQSEAQSQAERRERLVETAEQIYAAISAAILEEISAAAPAAKQAVGKKGEWSLALNTARLDMTQFYSDPPGMSVAKFEILGVGELGIEVRNPKDRYRGRRHSLWFCDAQDKDEFAWFETAFMNSQLRSGSPKIIPFTLSKADAVRDALMTAMSEYQVAWPFTRIVPGDLDPVVDRWAQWFADAALGALQRPVVLPEGNVAGSWRQ